MSKLSIIVICYNMQREAARTLRSLSADYQIGVDENDYEVIVIDNNSAKPLNKSDVEQWGPNFRYVFFETDSVSPVEVVNAGVAMANSPNFALIVDGARMASPGLIQKTLVGLEAFEQPFVFSLSWHLGPTTQNFSMLQGYNQESEDRLLETISWPQDGYKLFDIATLAPSSGLGFYAEMPSECSWLAMRKDTFDALGGFETRFQTPGGGLMNHDFRNRVLNVPDIELVTILGDGVFHQYHGGVSTNVDPQTQNDTLRVFYQEYREIRGADYKVINPGAVSYVGDMHERAARFIYNPNSDVSKV